MTNVSEAEVRAELERVVTSPIFLRSEKLVQFLRYIVEKTLDGEADTLKEYSLGIYVYQRKQDYEPRTDSTVRVEATRLRTKLMEYYNSTGGSGLRIDLPKGTYVPRFVAVTGDSPVASEKAAADLDPPPPMAASSAARFPWLWIIVGLLASVLAAGAFLRRTESKHAAPGVDARRHFLEGHRLWAQTPLGSPLQPVIAEFSKAVANDANFARGWADLAAAQAAQSDVDRQGRGEWLAKARASELRAIALDPTLPSPHRLMAARYLFDEWKFPQAVEEFAKATRLDPSDSHTQFLYISALAINGDLEEAERQSDAAVLANPRAAEASAVRAQVHLWWRRYKQAREEARRAVDLDSSDSFAHWMAGLAAQLDGDLSAAEAAYGEALRRNPRESRAMGSMAHLRAQQGRVEEAKQILKAAMAQFDSRQGWYYSWAMLHAAAGDRALALDSLERAVSDHEGSAPYAALEPRFDSLHNDPRFEKITAFLRKRP